MTNRASDEVNTGVQRPENAAVEIRPDSKGKIDEIIIRGGNVHIEQMDKASWFMGVEAADGDYWQFWCGSENRKTSVDFRHTEHVPASENLRSPVMTNPSNEKVMVQDSSPVEKRTDDIMNDAQIKHMVDRFLGWKLPRDTFNPDCGISFDKEPYNMHTPYPSKYEPSGTNLFDATQAAAMVRYMVEGLPAPTPPAPTEAQIEALKPFASAAKVIDKTENGRRLPDTAMTSVTVGACRKAQEVVALSTPTPDQRGLSEGAIANIVCNVWRAHYGLDNLSIDQVEKARNDINLSLCFKIARAISFAHQLSDHRCARPAKKS